MEVPVLKVEGLSDPDPAREVIMRLVSVLMFVAAVILSSHPSIAQQPQFPGPQVPPKGAERNGPFSVCIGDSCNGTGDYNNVNAGLNCDFAAANPHNTDEQAAKLVCMIYNNFTSYVWVRKGSASGGKCGVIYDLVRCID